MYTSRCDVIVTSVGMNIVTAPNTWRAYEGENIVIYEYLFIYLAKNMENNICVLTLL